MSDPQTKFDMSPLPAGFVSDVLQICIVTRDYRRVITGFLKLGIGPWRVYTLGPDTVSNMTYRGQARPHVMKICLAASGSMGWEMCNQLLSQRSTTNSWKSTVREFTTSRSGAPR